MDFFLPLVFAILFPISLDLGDIKYTPEAGIFVSDQQKKGGFGLFIDKYKTTSILSGYSDRVVSNNNIRYTKGNAKISYEAFVNYKVNLAFKNRLWVANRISWTPMREEMSISFINPSSPTSRPTTRILYFNELPAVGGVLGFDVLKYTPNTFWGLFDFSLSPYVGASFFRLSYATANEFESQSFYTNAFKWYAGVNMQLDYNAKLYFEYSNYEADIKSASGLGQNIKLNVSRVKIGFSYVFTDDSVVRKSNKDTNYEEIFKSLDEASE